MEFWRMVIFRLKIVPASMLVVLGLLGGCADSGFDLSGIGQDRACAECQAHRDNTEYRDCIARVNKDYDDLRSQRSEKDNKTEK
jgi:hypothetical protein